LVLVLGLLVPVLVTAHFRDVWKFAEDTVR
jgi:hypothetical protein